MKRVCRAAILMSTLLFAHALPAKADINLDYQGAFRALPASAYVYNGDMTFYAAGNGGAGSLLISDSPGGAHKEVFAVDIPAPKIVSNVSELNVANILYDFDTMGATGMTYRSTDGRLYLSTTATGSAQMRFRSINPDGTGESTDRYAPNWQSGGAGLAEAPADWAATYAGGKNVLSVVNVYGARIVSVDPWNAPVSTPTTVIGYNNDHRMNGYDSQDKMEALAWVNVGGEANIIVGGLDTSEAAATFWFFRVADIENAANAYDVQPYQVLSIQDQMLVTNRIWGMTYDDASQTLYAYESSYGQPGIVHAWRIVDDPPAAVNDLAAAATDWFQVTLTWTAPSDDHGPGGAVAGYDLRYATVPIDASNWDSAIAVSDAPAGLPPGSVQSVDVTGLEAYTTYYFALKASDGVNTSDLSNVATVTTNTVDAIPPAAINDLSASNILPNRATLTWSSVGDDGMDGQAARVEIRYATMPLDETTWADATLVEGVAAPQEPGSEESLVLRGLVPSTNYWVGIKTADEVPNWSAISNVVMLTTLEADLDAPEAVIDLAVLGALPKIVYLRWTAPADVGSAGMAGYDLRYSTSPIVDETTWDAATQVQNEPVPAAPGTLVEFAVTGLQAETLFYFAMKSYDYAEPTNISPMSNVVNTTTPAEPFPVTIANPWIVNDRVADTHNIDTMGATYGNAYTPDGVVPPAGEEEMAINIYNNQKRRLYHWAVEPPNGLGTTISDPTYVQNIFGWVLCGRHADQACTIAKAAGLTPRKLALPGHWVYEIKYADGTYHFYDTMTTCYVYDRATPARVASMGAIQQDNSLITAAVAEGRACPGFLLCGDSPTFFTNGYSPGADGSGVVAARWTGDMDLSSGQTFRRTWEAWQNQHPTSTVNADADPGNDPPYHHEANKDWKDTVNWPYWEPYGLRDLNIISNKDTYRRWANGTHVLAPDFRSPGYQAMLVSSSNIATFNDDGLSPDLHVATPGGIAEVVFKIDIPYYLTDAYISGDFVRNSTADSVRVLYSANGTTWTQVWAHSGTGVSHVENLSLRSQVLGKFSYYIKVEMNASTAQTDAGVSDLVINTIFQHNKGAMAYLDKGVNNITVTFDNADVLLGSRSTLQVTYKWKEYDGTGWTIARERVVDCHTSPTTFTITAAGDKVPRTEEITMAVVPAVPDFTAPMAVADLAAEFVDATRVDLTWTATGDDGALGTASIYDIRYSMSPINEGNWDAATPADGEPAPMSSGATERFVLTGLQPLTTYYIAMKVGDEVPNYSGLSNVLMVTTTAPDVTAPAAITDLAGTPGTQSGSVQLSWTAPGDDGMVGTAVSYEIRYATSPIDAGNWDAATPVDGVPAPQDAGTPESLLVTGLAWSQQYYFAIKTADEVPNVSALSNVAAVTSSGLGEKILQYGLDGYTGVRDNYMYAGGATTNYGGIERMTVCGYASQGAGNIQRGMVRFDLSSVPAGTAITSAKLYLYSYDAVQSKGSSGFYGVYRLTRDWSESASSWNQATGSVAWTTPGGDFLAGPDATSAKQPNASPCWYEWDVTDAVQEMIDGPAANFGWVVKCTDEMLSMQERFYQSDTVNAEFRPKLVISDLPLFKQGDLNKDGSVNVIDLLIMSKSWNKSQGDEGFDPRADIDGNGSVNVLDLLALARDWPQS